MVLGYEEKEVRGEPLGVSRGWMEAETHHGRRFPTAFQKHIVSSNGVRVRAPGGMALSPKSPQR